MRRPAIRTRNSIALLASGATAFAATVLIAPAEGAPAGNGVIAYGTDREGDHEIFIRSVSGTGQVTHTNLTNNTVGDYMPVYSPDGQQIAFTRGAESGTDIWVMTASGQNARRITKGVTPYGAPTWSPDGTQLAYAAPVAVNKGKTQLDIFTISLTGTASPVNITNHPAGDSAPDWSVDGVIAFVSQRGRNSESDVYTMSSTGADVTPLGINQSPRFPTWSPDGDRLAVITWDNELGNTIMLRSSTGALTRITSGPYDEVPEWSPDGTKLVYASVLGNGKNAKRRLFMVEAKPGGSPVAISDDPGATLSHSDGSPDWQPVPLAITPTGSASPSPSATCILTVCV
jgi:Tol biopolymer transport system component